VENIANRLTRLICSMQSALALLWQISIIGDIINTPCLSAYIIIHLLSHCIAQCNSIAF